MGELRLGALEERVGELKAQLERVEDNMELSDDFTADILARLKEKVGVLEVQNMELRDQLNLVINGHNRVVLFLNNRFTQASPVDVAPQSAVQQVHDMYLSQAPTEEEWQDMSEAFEVAKENGAAMAEQLFKSANGDNTCRQ